MTRAFTAVIAVLLEAGLLSASAPVSASEASVLSHLASADCGVATARTALWRATHLLDEAARRWAAGADLGDAVARSGYAATAVSALRFYGLDAADRPRLDAASCRVLGDRSLQDLGAFRRGDELWVVFASPASLPDSEDAGASLALKLVNEARDQGHRCGNRFWPRANPVRLSAELSEIARRHALDMAHHHYFDHRDQSGHTPADRVRAAGYSERRIAENIAYGPLSTEDVIAGWLKSPEHCENLMDPLVKEMGIAFATASAEQGELYWVQLFADPR